MDQISDLVLMIFQHCVMPWLLPVFVWAAFVFMSGGRAGAVFTRCVSMFFSLTRMFFRMVLDLISAFAYRKVTRRSPPKDRHLRG
ncbi:MAG: hypothetical protein K2W95_36625 [Candidatus Obscuribacterales bacterium]|nr:hypothetical protein [Candidatus Obscuribacterales bacterium]